MLVIILIILLTLHIFPWSPTQLSVYWMGKIMHTYIHFLQNLKLRWKAFISWKAEGSIIYGKCLYIMAGRVKVFSQHLCLFIDKYSVFWVFRSNANKRFTATYSGRLSAKVVFLDLSYIITLGLVSCHLA